MVLRKYLIKPEVLLPKIRKSYNLSFLGSVLGIPQSRVYVFGGVVRDLLLGRGFKDLDIRVLVNKPRVIRERVIESALSRHVKHYEKIFFSQGDFTVYRFLPGGSKNKNYIDLTVARTIKQARSDFTINDIFVDIRNGEILDRHNGLADLQQRRLRTLINPMRQFEEEPHMLFRVLKIACQFDLRIDPLVFRAIKRRHRLAYPLFDRIATGRRGLWVEVLSGSFFRGLNYDPMRYFGLLLSTKLFGVFLDFLRDKLLTQFVLPQGQQNIFPKNSGTDLNQNLSRFLTFVANLSPGGDREDLFNKAKRLLALDEPKYFGELPIRPSEVRYLD